MICRENLNNDRSNKERKSNQEKRGRIKKKKRNTEINEER